jgi:hypothetical protein
MLCPLESIWPLLLVFSFNTDFQMHVAHHTLRWLYIIHSIFPQCTVFVGSHCLQMFMLIKLLASVNKGKKIIHRTSNSKDYITKWSDTIPLKHMFTKKSDVNILDTNKCHISFISNEYEKYVIRMLCSRIPTLITKISGYFCTCIILVPLRWQFLRTTHFKYML